MKRTVKNPGIRINKKEMLREKLQQENPEEAARIATIQMLIPMGLELVKEKGENLSHVPKLFKKDREIVLCAVCTCGWIVQYI